MSTNLNRWLVITVITVFTLTTTFFGHINLAQAADKIDLRMSISQPDNSIQGLAYTRFSKLIGEDFKFTPYYSNTLFKQGTEIPALQRGNLEMANVSAADIAKQMPEFSIFMAGYVIRDQDHLRKVFKGEIGAEMYKKIEDQMKIKLIGCYNLGTRQLNLRGTKKIMKPEDLKGVKLRMPTSESYQFLGKALGADVTPMAFQEVYTGLQTGAIDAQDNPLPNTKVMKFYEVTKQIILTGHLVDPQYIAVAKTVWDKLTPQQKSKMQAAADEACAYNDELTAKDEAECAEFFKKQGLEVYKPDLEAFRQYAQKMYLGSKYAEVWPKGLLDRINAVK
ncbi:MAG: DctP family TRAP transporter solute-binding subunit [Deltaproteobacteria bacterium]|nr:DctP family TRAP transporter solute-binding subunit [Deltaproteobacteria bacterium]